MAHATAARRICRAIGYIATICLRTDVQAKVSLLAIRVSDRGASARCEIENVFAIHIRDWNLRLETRPLFLVWIDRGVIFLFAPPEPIALLPFAHLAALIIVSERALEIGIEPEPKRAIHYGERAGQKVFTEHLSSTTIAVVAIDSIPKTFNSPWGLRKTNDIACAHKREQG